MNIKRVFKKSSVIFICNSARKKIFLDNYTSFKRAITLVEIQDCLKKKLIIMDFPGDG